jgi:hypothetical protein
MSGGSDLDSLLSGLVLLLRNVDEGFRSIGLLGSEFEEFMDLLSLSGCLLQHSSFLRVSRFVVVGLVNVVEGLVGTFSCLLG